MSWWQGGTEYKMSLIWGHLIKIFAQNIIQISSILLNVILCIHNTQTSFILVHKLPSTCKQIVWLAAHMGQLMTGRYISTHQRVKKCLLHPHLQKAPKIIHTLNEVQKWINSNLTYERFSLVFLLVCYNNNVTHLSPFVYLNYCW